MTIDTQETLESKLGHIKTQMPRSKEGVRMNGSAMLVEALHLEGVKVIFGYPGGAVLNIYDEIYKQMYFKHILVRHEQAAVHAADGYARASGKVGVAVVTSGPGLTNAITGIATAFTDSIPLVVVSGQVPLTQIGTDSFQEIDAVGISRPCTKHNYLVKSIEDLPRILKEAFYIARSGRPGPVLIDIPKDISAQVAEFHYPASISLATYKPTIRGNLRQIKKLANVILESNAPLFYIGGGAMISDSYDEIRELLKITEIPSVETLMARGLAQGDKHFLGMLGMHGTYAANMATSECDLLVSLGARFDDRVTGKVSEFAKYATIAHIDIDPSSIGKIIDVNYPVVGNLKLVLQDLINELRDKTPSESVLKEREAWKAKLHKWRATHPLSFEDCDDLESMGQGGENLAGTASGHRLDFNLERVGGVQGVIESKKYGQKCESSVDSKTQDFKGLDSKSTTTKPPFNSEAKDSKNQKPHLKPQWVIQKTGEILGDQAVVVTDVGQHQMWVAQFYPFSQKRQFITSGGLGTMGFGMPANIGVAFALQEMEDSLESTESEGGAGLEDSKTIPTQASLSKTTQNKKIALSFSGDGGILMNIQELMTCAESSIKTINIILNNGYLGMVKQWQDFFYEKRLSHVNLTQPNFVALANAFGVLGLEVHTKEEFVEALQKAIQSEKTSLINVLVDRDEIVLPMVPGGNPIYKMILE